MQDAYACIYTLTKTVKIKFVYSFWALKTTYFEGMKFYAWVYVTKEVCMLPFSGSWLKMWLEKGGVKVAGSERCFNHDDKWRATWTNLFGDYSVAMEYSLGLKWGVQSSSEEIYVCRNKCVTNWLTQQFHDC